MQSEVKSLRNIKAIEDFLTISDLSSPKQEARTEVPSNFKSSIPIWQNFIYFLAFL